MKSGSRNNTRPALQVQSSVTSYVNPIAPGELRSWRLPSGQPLAEFALCSGFLAPQLLRHLASQSHRTSGPAGAKEKEA